MGGINVSIEGPDGEDLAGWHTDEEGNHTWISTTPLRLDDLRVTNLSRCVRWHPGFPDDDWTGADWSNAMQGEAGEAGNVVKKLRRKEFGLAGAHDPGVQELTEKLADEIADTIIYADLLAAYYGIDLSTAIRRKFNAISEREGFPERL